MRFDQNKNRGNELPLAQVEQIPGDFGAGNGEGGGTKGTEWGSNRAAPSQIIIKSPANKVQRSTVPAKANPLLITRIFTRGPLKPKPLWLSMCTQRKE